MKQSKEKNIMKITEEENIMIKNAKTKETSPIKDRAYYKEIFYKQWEQYNYIFVPDMRGDGVEYLIDELNEKYPPFWFMTSHGRVFSVANGKLRQLTPIYNPGSNGKRRWEYIYDGKHYFVHQMVAEHCCPNPYGKDVDVELHHITPTKKFGQNDCFIANQSCNLQWIPKPLHNEITYRYAVKEPDDIFKKVAAKAPIEIQVPDVTEWVCSILNTGTVSDLGMYKYEDLKENQFRDHDVSYTFVENPKIEPIEGNGYLITDKYIFFAEGNGNFLQENKNMLDSAMDTMFSDCITSEEYFCFEFEDKAKDKNIIISVKLKETED